MSWTKVLHCTPASSATFTPARLASRPQGRVESDHELRDDQYGREGCGQRVRRLYDDDVLDRWPVEAGDVVVYHVSEGHTLAADVWRKT